VALYAVTTPAMLVLSVALKWLVLGKIRPGRYPLWGSYYLRFWFVRSVIRSVPVHYLSGTPFLNFYYRMLGCKIGKDVVLGSNQLSTFDLIRIGDGTSIGMDSNLRGVSIENGMIRISAVTIGNHCTVGNRSTLGANSFMADGSMLGDLSLLPDNTRVGAGELWAGSPASHVGEVTPCETRRPWSLVNTLAQFVGIFTFPLVILVAVFPGLMLITRLGHQDAGYTHLLAAPVVGLSFVVFLGLEVVAMKWLLLGRMREGRYAIDSFFYVRKWFFDNLMQMSLEILGSLYTTLYIRPWLRALGTNLGTRSEVSTIRFLHPDLLETGPECFLADDVSVGAPDVRGGFVTVGRTKLGARTFIGNGAVLPGGTRLGSNVLVGSLSLPPTGGDVPDRTTWFGSPSMALAARQRPVGFDEAATYKPGKRLVALRIFIEFFRVILPSTLFVVLAEMIINVTDELQDYIGFGEWFMLLPIIYIAAGITAVVATAALKWVMMGRYKVSQHPLWSTFVWRSELVTGVYENLAVKFFLDLLRGTPFIAPMLRLFGVKVGRRCYIDTTWFSEFDLVHIGDEVALNDHSNVQTHLFQDRVMALGRVDVGNRAVLGGHSTILYDASMEAGASVGDLSLVMKGERIPSSTRWHGIPARVDKAPDAIDPILRKRPWIRSYPRLRRATFWVSRAVNARRVRWT
jgi:non-ribosomal peptide synthetase-like protein